MLRAPPAASYRAHTLLPGGQEGAAFARDARRKSYASISTALGVALVAAFIGFLGSFGSAWVGAGRRIFVAIFLLWLLLTAARLRSIASGFRERLKGPLATV